jgi:ABC-type transporter Mla MlaB component
MLHVWRAFTDLTGTRQVGMAAGPITYSEIQAYRAASFADLTAWEVGVIRRLDTAALAVLAGAAPKARPDADGLVSINDRKGVRAVLSGIRDRIGLKGRKR